MSEAAHSLGEIGVDLEEGGEASQIEDLGDKGAGGRGLDHQGLAATEIEDPARPDRA